MKKGCTPTFLLCIFCNFCTSTFIWHLVANSDSIIFSIFFYFFLFFLFLFVLYLPFLYAKDISGALNHRKFRSVWISKMVKHTQTIRRLILFDHFVGLVLKSLTFIYVKVGYPLHVFFETFQSGLKYRKTRLHDFDIRLDLEIIHAPNGYSFSSESIINKNYDAFVTKQPFNFLWIQNRKIWFSALIFYPKTIEINKSFSSLTQTKFRLANLNFIFWKDEF